jgi:putative tricarboxylic transport membrane protein
VSITLPDDVRDTGVAAPPAGHGRWRGRSGLLLAAVLAAFATYLLVGIVTMDVPEGADSPGPAFFPTLIMVAGYVLAVLLAVDTMRHPQVPAPATFAADDDVTAAERAAAEAAARRTYRAYTDWPSVLWCAGGFLAFAVLLEPLGWVLAAALLFWCVAHGFGSRRPLFDVSLALVVSSAVYLAFAVALGLNLPAGILGGVH